MPPLSSTVLAQVAAAGTTLPTIATEVPSVSVAGTQAGVTHQGLSQAAPWHQPTMILDEHQSLYQQTVETTSHQQSLNSFNDMVSQLNVQSQGDFFTQNTTTNSSFPTTTKKEPLYVSKQGTLTVTGQVKANILTKEALEKSYPFTKRKKVDSHVEW